MLPSQSWESAEVGVSGHHSAAMLDRDGRVLSVGDQLPYGSRLAAQPLEYVQVVRSGTHYARRGAFQERGQECERQVESGWRVEDSGVGYDADETGQNEDGESERFRSRRQASDPGCIRGVVRGGILDVRVYAGHSRREAASRINGSRVRTRLLRPGHRAPSAGRDRPQGGRERHAR